MLRLGHEDLREPLPTLGRRAIVEAQAVQVFEIEGESAPVSRHSMVSAFLRPVAKRVASNDTRRRLRGDR